MLTGPLFCLLFVCGNAFARGETIFTNIIIIIKEKKEKYIERRERKTNVRCVFLNIDLFVLRKAKEKHRRGRKCLPKFRLRSLRRDDISVFL